MQKHLLFGFRCPYICAHNNKSIHLIKKLLAMAKVSDIKYELDGLDLKTPLNCNSSGEFSANLPEIVANTLGLPQKITAATLNEASRIFNESVAKFKTSTTTEEFMIAINYTSSGRYENVLTAILS